ncbi:unnamed protein product [Owenia fusiformis]|uniref:RNase H type-1 domain-containing protein n=1 Tax=Owenia fusiformis TaxID=6347 RepID=A0A8S4NLX2_OWEFU|nr:unnamed protein product [Owenia fusiformis]
MILVVPGAKMYTKVANNSLSKAMRNSKLVEMSDDLLREVQYWRFLEGYVPWRKECHKNLVLASDSSLYAYGLVLGDSIPGQENQGVISDYWEGDDSRPIHLKEAHAVLNGVNALSNELQNCRVRIMVDNQSVVQSWNNGGCKSLELNDILKSIFMVCLEKNIDPSLSRISTLNNPADMPSRRLSNMDAMLQPGIWAIIEHNFGPHSVDLMSLDSNSLVDRHFTPSPLPKSSGVDVFSQKIETETNPYVFPPFCMVLPVTRYLVERKVQRCTIVVAERCPLDPWWPVLNTYSVSKIFLAGIGSKEALLYPSKRGFIKDQYGLKFNLWAFRVSMS